MSDMVEACERSDRCQVDLEFLYRQPLICSASRRSGRSSGGARSPTSTDQEDDMPEATTILIGSLTSAGVAMRAALAGISPEEMTREPGEGWRSIESLLGEATMAMRDALVAIGHEDLPEVPGGFEARYARWGMAAELDEAVPDLAPIFSEHLETLGGAVRTPGPHHLDDPVDPPGSLDEDGHFPFSTVGTMIFSVSGRIHFLAGEASGIRLALGKSPATDPFDDLLGGGD
jgi:hypothetical protein